MSSAFGRLLLVDDEASVRDILTDYFTAQGHVVETVTDGTAALGALTERPYDLVLLDIRMPGLDGVEVLKRIRAHSTVPVIMVTANEDVALARLTLKLGAFDYVAKPFDFAYLDRAVTAALLHAPRAPEPVVPVAPSSPDDPWRALALTLFKVTRAMTPVARASTGEQLLTSALAAARHARASEPAGALRDLEDLELVLSIAHELGDLGTAECETIRAAVDHARKGMAAAE